MAWTLEKYKKLNHSDGVVRLHITVCDGGEMFDVTVDPALNDNEILDVIAAAVKDSRDKKKPKSNKLNLSSLDAKIQALETP